MLMYGSSSHGHDRMQSLPQEHPIMLAGAVRSYSDAQVQREGAVRVC